MVSVAQVEALQDSHLISPISLSMGAFHGFSARLRVCSAEPQLAYMHTVLDVYPSVARGSIQGLG